MIIPKGYFIDVTNIPLKDRIKLFPQFENSYCRCYLTNVKCCVAVNHRGAVETYSTTEEKDGLIPYYKKVLIREGLKEIYCDSLGGL